MNLADEHLKQIDALKLTVDERAVLRCRIAADLINAGQYEQAREALGDLWQGTGARPNLAELTETTAAEVLLQCGSLTGYLGASKPEGGAQDKAKDLISEAHRLFEAHGLHTKVEEAEYELSVCYWRAGALDEARAILRQAAQRLGTNEVTLKAQILIRSTVVEISAGRYHDALSILDEAEPVFNDAPDAIKGRWHGQRGMVLRRLGAAENRPDYLDRAIIEFTAASVYFEQVKHERYCGNAENNLAMLLNRMGRHAEAHRHADRAQSIFTRLEDAGSLGQVRETRARIFLAEGEHDKAQEAITGAVCALEKTGELALLSDALAVQATIQARLGKHDLSLSTFRRAVEVAEDAGALESAGLAYLCMTEEHGETRLSETELYEAYCRADDLLQRTQDAETIARLRVCARLIARRLTEVRMDDDFYLPEAVRKYEARFVGRALKDANGIVTRAAKRLGITYQLLVYLLETRHKDLMAARRPIVKRKRSTVKKAD